VTERLQLPRSAVHTSHRQSADAEADSEPERSRSVCPLRVRLGGWSPPKTLRFLDPRATHRSVRAAHCTPSLFFCRRFLLRALTRPSLCVFFCSPLLFSCFFFLPGAASLLPPSLRLRFPLAPVHSASRLCAMRCVATLCSFSADGTSDPNHTPTPRAPSIHQALLRAQRLLTCSNSCMDCLLPTTTSSGSNSGASFLPCVLCAVLCRRTRTAVSHVLDKPLFKTKQETGACPCACWRRVL
jgi:hypothetical protein